MCWCMVGMNDETFLAYLEEDRIVNLFKSKLRPVRKFFSNKNSFISWWLTNINSYRLIEQVQQLVRMLLDDHTKLLQIKIVGRPQLCLSDVQVSERTTGKRKSIRIVWLKMGA